MNICKWWHKKKKQWDEEDHQRGYNYAAGQLLAAQTGFLGAKYILDKLIAEADDPFQMEYFNKGIIQAVSDWHRFMNKPVSNWESQCG